MAKPRITGYHHVTHNISRDNVEAARHFYRDLLGLEEIPATEDPTGKRLIWFNVGNQQLHLMIRDKPDAASSRHFAVVLEDFDGFLENLVRQGVRLDHFESGKYWKERSNGSRAAWCYDPDGNRIELTG